MSARFLSPWAVTDDNGVRCYIRNSQDRSIARVMCGDTLADARLMAAAPELLEALQDALQYLSPLLPDEALLPHRAAIAKATGKQA